MTLKNDAVNSAGARKAAQAQLDEIADLFSKAKGVKVNIVAETEATAPGVKSQLKGTPFIRIDE